MGLERVRDGETLEGIEKGRRQRFSLIEVLKREGETDLRRDGRNRRVSEAKGK